MTARQHAFAAALLDPARPVPEGWVGHNGADAAARFAVYRNNVVVSLMAALGATFPATRRALGSAAFDALARWHVVEHPPRSAVLSDWGDAFPAWLATHPAGADRPWLTELARLERARVRACHAADADALGADTLAARLADPARLPLARLGLHPSLQVQHFDHAVVSYWAAAQKAGACPEEPGLQAEHALVLRDPDDDVRVVPVSAAAALFVRRLGDGVAFGPAAAEAGDALDLPAVLAGLIRHGVLCTWHDDGDER